MNKLEQVGVFFPGESGVPRVRIPAVAVTNAGTILAFCEARDGDDQSPTDLAAKRSFDGGRTWGPLQLVVKASGPDAIMDPCPVVDRSTGRIHLFCNFFPGGRVQARPPGAVRVLLSASDTDGLSWSPTLDVTARVADEKNDLYVISGPGVGIQDAAGRLLIPLGIGPEASAQATVAISEDHGKNWQRGGRAQSTSTETQIVELADGTLRLDMRNQRDAEQPAHCRYFALSRDGGRTWTPPRKDPGLICVRCQGSILRYTGGPGAKIPNRLLSAAPSSTYRNRVNMTVRLSYDEGQTWPVAKTIHPGPCAYSCLAILPDGSIGLLYEGGGKGRYDEIRFARFTLNWLTAGADRGDTTE